MIDLTGKKFNDWVVLGFGERRNLGKGSFRYWKCQCSCGIIKNIREYNLLDGDSKRCRSCSSILKSIPRRLQHGEGAFNKLYKSYGRKAKERNLNFNLTKEEFKLITKSNCFYCNIEPYQLFSGAYGDYIYNGIDRKNNDVGYEIDNCIAACGICNKMKMELGYEKFIKQCRLITNNIKV